MPGSPLRRLNSLVANLFPFLAGGTAVIGLLLWGVCFAIHSKKSNDWVLFLYLLPVLVQAAGLSILAFKLYRDLHKSEPNRMRPQERLALESFAVFYFGACIEQLKRNRLFGCPHG